MIGARHLDLPRWNRVLLLGVVLGANSCAPHSEPTAASFSSRVDASQALSRLYQQEFTPADADRQRVMALEGWDDFYRDARQLNLNTLGLQELIVRRLAFSRDWSDDQVDSLLDLLVQEQVDVTDAAARRFGGHQNLLGYARNKEERDSFWSEVKKIRRRVRDSWKPRYDSVFSAQDLVMIDRHLRNDSVALDVMSEGTTVIYRIAGVGR